MENKRDKFLERFSDASIDSNGSIKYEGNSTHYASEMGQYLIRDHPHIAKLVYGHKLSNIFDLDTILLIAKQKLHFLSPLERLEFISDLTEGYCKNCGFETNGICYCERDE